MLYTPRQENTINWPLVDYELAKPVGFLFQLNQKDKTKLESSTARRFSRVVTVKKQFIALQEMFPTFPKSMLRAMFIQFEGNSSAVASSLVKRGWSKKRNHDCKLSKKVDPNFTTPYYFGLWEERLKQHFKNAESGSYITAVVEKRKCTYVYKLIYLNQSGCLERRTLKEPTVAPKLVEFLQLTPIQRPAGFVFNPIPFCA
jgi:hypothetical protein